MSPADFLALNGLADETKIYPGQQPWVIPSSERRPS